MQIHTKELTRKLRQTKPGLAKRKSWSRQARTYLRMGKSSPTTTTSPCQPLPGRLSGAVAGEDFYKAIRSAPTATVDITADDERVFIRSGEMVVEIEKAEILLPIQDVPQHEPGDWVSLTPDFKEKSKLAAGAASKNLSRPTLGCIHMRREHSLFLKMRICSIRIPLFDNNLNSLDIFMSLDYGNVGTQAQRRDIWGCLLFPRSRKIMQGRGGIGGLST